MTLDPSALETAIADVFASMPASPAEAAEALASAYRDYAAAGMFGASTIAFTGLEVTALTATLAGGMVVPGAAAVFAAAWATGITAFWIAVPVVGAQTGATVGAPGAAALTATLTAVFSNLANTAETASAGLAAALHTATQTVTAIVAPPPATVLPIA